MKLLFPFFLLASTCLADPPQATLDALKVVGAENLPVKEKRIAKENLPTGLLQAMSQFDWGGSTGKIPKVLDFLIVDLNADKSPEYFAKTFMGGSGGPLYLVFSKVNGTWKCIGESGNFQLLPKKNGWHPIVSFGRSGPYHFKHFYEFQNGRYHHIETHEILDGKVTKIKQNATERPVFTPKSSSK